ncbi:lantibiotic dehydratase family protein [Aceticella autotrophica]|uniref:lantibiotic dehydratase family protein n=1 Tax=Aceticella autotrophica TaxID=2755338 RepID=UPI0025429BE3|nr:lantibiotic dehydratase family protein [Aceticella autotrophica]
MKCDIYQNINTFMIRNPALPIENYYKLFSKSINKEQSNEYIRVLCNDTIFRESILVSSKDLYDKMIKFAKGGKISKSDYFFRSIYKYLIRMTTRSTPFGLLAGIDFRQYSDNETSIFYNESRFHKFARPDFEWIMKLVKEIEIKYYQNLWFKNNAGIFIKGDRAVLVYSTVKNEKDNIDEISIRATSAFKTTYELTKQRIKYSDLKANLLEKYPLENEEKINNFLKQLIESEFLISNLRPPLTVPDQFEYLIKEIRKSNINEKLLENLVSIQRGIDIYNNTVGGNAEKLYLGLTKKMNDITGAKTPLQVDMRINLKEKKLQKNIVNKINELMNLLLSLSKKNNSLTKYKEDFIEKYGLDREIPLLEMIDNDLGIGPPASYIHPRNNRLVYYDENEIIDEKVREYFLQKHVYALRHNFNYIELKDDEIENLNLPKYSYDEIPNSIELDLIVKSDSQNEIKDQNLHYFIGPFRGSTHAGKSFGRFSHVMENSVDFFNKLNKL